MALPTKNGSHPKPRAQYLADLEQLNLQLPLRSTASKGRAQPAVGIAKGPVKNYCKPNVRERKRATKRWSIPGHQLARLEPVVPLSTAAASSPGSPTLDRNALRRGAQTRPRPRLQAPKQARSAVAGPSAAQVHAD